MTKDMPKVKDLLLLRKCSDRTISNYLSYINRFKNYYKRKDLEKLNEDDILEYLKKNFINIGCSATTINVNRAAIKYYYLVNFNKNFSNALLPQTKIPSRFHKIISKQDFIKIEIINFLNILNNPSHFLLLLPSPKTKTKNFIMSKAFITFTGIEQNHKRRKLLNKTTFLTTSSNPWTEFMDFICKIYDFSKYKNIKVFSDAGTWIVNEISNLKLYPENEIMHCLCEFHVKQKINRITKDKNQME